MTQITEERRHELSREATVGLPAVGALLGYKGALYKIKMYGEKTLFLTGDQERELPIVDFRRLLNQGKFKILSWKGLHVKEGTRLGDVMEELPNGRLRVRYFNGEMWKNEPLTTEVEVI